jgi:hypothetical protein
MAAARRSSEAVTSELCYSSAMVVACQPTRAMLCGSTDLGGIANIRGERGQVCIATARRNTKQQPVTSATEALVACQPTSAMLCGSTDLGGIANVRQDRGQHLHDNSSKEEEEQQSGSWAIAGPLAGGSSLSADIRYECCQRCTVIANNKHKAAVK